MNRSRSSWKRSRNWKLNNYPLHSFYYLVSIKVIFFDFSLNYLLIFYCEIGMDVITVLLWAALQVARWIGRPPGVETVASAGPGK